MSCYGAFAELRDALLSEPLDRSRAMWQIFLIPYLEDGRVALIGKIHHSLVDGIAALQIVALVTDPVPDATSDGPAAWRPAGHRSRVGWAREELTRTAGGVSERCKHGGRGGAPERQCPRGARSAAR